MDELPTFLVHDILSRLPIHQLMQYRSVCKSWLDIIDDPYFRKILHLPSESMVFGYLNGDMNTGPIIYNITREGDEMKAKKMVNFPELCGFRSCVCSCNGFLLFVRSILERRRIHIVESALVNPFTKETVRVPESPYQSSNVLSGQALGFEPSTNTYKLVQVAIGRQTFLDQNGIRDAVYDFKASVYDFKSRCWRFCNGPRQFVETPGVCVDGALNWISKEGLVTKKIVSFNLRHEKFTIIPIHVRLDLYGIRVKLAEMAGTLALFGTTGRYYIDIWIASRVDKGYSWHRKSRVRVLFPDRQVITTSRLMGFVYYQEKLLIRGFCKTAKRKRVEDPMFCFALYDLKDNQFKFCVRDGLHSGLSWNTATLNPAYLRQPAYVPS